MTSAADAIEAATYAALNGQISLDVYQHIPQDAPPPYAVIGAITLESFGTKDADPDRQGVLTIGVIFEGEERKPVHAAQDEIETILDGLTATSVEGWSIQFGFISSDVVMTIIEPVDDETPGGEQYVGTSRFRVLALSN